MIQINFSPKKYIDSVRINLILAKVILLAFIIVLIVGVVSSLRYVRYQNLIQEYTNLEKEKQLLNKQLEVAKDIENKIKHIETYISSINKITTNRYLYVAFMQDLVNNLPSTVWFSGINTRSTENTIDVTINVNSNTLEDLLWWFSYIDHNKKRYSDAKITSINYTADYYTTQISFKYRYLL